MSSRSVVLGLAVISAVILRPSSGGVLLGGGGAVAGVEALCDLRAGKGSVVEEQLHLQGDDVLGGGGEVPRQVQGRGSECGRGHVAGGTCGARGADDGHDGVAFLFGGDEAVQGGSVGTGGVVDGRVHVTGEDRGDTDVGAVLRAEHVGGGGDRPLGDDVGAGEGELEVGQQRRGDYDPAPALQERGQGGGRDAPGAEQIDLDGLAGVCVGHVADVYRGADPGVVDQQVESAVELFDGLGDGFAHLGLIGDVAPDDPGPGLAVDADHVHTEVPQDVHGGAAEGAGGAGDDGVEARQTAQVGRQGGRHVISSTVIAGTLQRTLSRCNGVSSVVYR